MPYYKSYCHLQLLSPYDKSYCLLISCVVTVNEQRMPVYTVFVYCKGGLWRYLLSQTRRVKTDKGKRYYGKSKTWQYLLLQNPLISGRFMAVFIVSEHMCMPFNGICVIHPALERVSFSMHGQFTKILAFSYVKIGS